MRTNQKILAGFVVLSIVVLSLKMRSPVIETSVPSGYAAPKSIAALKIEEDKAYVQAMEDLEIEEQAKLKAEAAKVTEIAGVIPATKNLKLAGFSPSIQNKKVSKSTKFAALKTKKINRNVAFKSAGNRKSRGNGPKVLVSTSLNAAKKISKSKI